METAMEQPLNWLRPHHCTQGIKKLVSKINSNIFKNPKQQPNKHSQQIRSLILKFVSADSTILENENLWKAFPV